jgi:hypothetical protein
VSGIECCSTRDSSLGLVVDDYSTNCVLRKVEVALSLYRQVVRGANEGREAFPCVALIREFGLACSIRLFDSCARSR